MSESFQHAIDRVSRDLPGSFAVCAERLDGKAGSDGARLAWNEDAVLPAASVIKLAVALEVMCAVAEGALDGNTLLEVREVDQVIGSGVLTSLQPGLRLPVSDVLYLAMAISDNTAANLLIDRVGVAAVNARLESLGLVQTRLAGTIFTGGGELSKATAAELVTLLRKVERREGLPARACKMLLALLERTQTASTIGRGLPDERFATPSTISLAYKTGSLVGIVAEAAIVRTPQVTYAVALLSEGSGDARPNHDNVGRVMLGEISRAIYTQFTA